MKTALHLGPLQTPKTLLQPLLDAFYLHSGYLLFQRQTCLEILSVEESNVVQKIQVGQGTKVCKDSKGENLLVCCQRDISVYRLDRSKNRFLQQGRQRIGSFLLTMTFVSKTLSVLVDKRGKVYTLQLLSSGFSLKHTKIAIEANSTFCDVVGCREHSQKGMILYSSRDRLRDYIMLQEISLEKIDTIEPLDLFNIPISSENSAFNIVNSKAYQFKEWLLLRFDSELVLVKKMHNKYYLFDSLSRDQESQTIQIIGSNHVVFLSQGEILFLKIQSAQDRLHYKEYDQLLLQIPVFKVLDVGDLQHTQFMVLFQQEKQVSFCKLVQIPLQQKIKLILQSKSIEEAKRTASVLGLDDKQFYLMAWKSIEREKSDLSILVKVRQFKTFQRELKLHLKYKKEKVQDLVAAYSKIKDQSQRQLMERPSFQSLKSYVKVSFLHRKLMAQSDIHRYIDYDQFKAIKDTHLFQRLLHEMRSSCVKQVNELLGLFNLQLVQEFRKFLCFLVEQLKQSLDVVVLRFKSLLPDLNKFQMFSMQDLNIETLSGSLHALHKRLWIPFSDNDYQEFENSSKLFQLAYNDGNTGLLKHEISTLIAKFVNSEWFVSKRHIKHGIILTSRTGLQEYQQGLKWRMFFYLVEHCNRLSIKNEAVLKLFKQNYRMSDSGIKKLSLYSKIHLLLVEQLTMDELLAMNDLQLFEFFFLSGKREKVLTDLKNIYNLACLQNKFNSSFSEFIKSEKCSFTELAWILNFIKSLGIDFQRQSTRLLGKMVDALMAKLRMADMPVVQQLFQILKEIYLPSKTLSVLAAVSDLITHKEDLLQLSASRLSLAQAVSPCFFFINHINSCLSGQVKEMQEQFYKLESIRTRAFRGASGRVLEQTYLKGLLEYQRFQQAKSIASRINVKIIQNIILIILSNLYHDSSIRDFSLLEAYILTLLQLIPAKTPFKRRERARVKLGIQLRKANVRVTPADLVKIESRLNFIRQISQQQPLNQSVDYAKIYKYLLKLSCKGLQKVQVYTPEFKVFLVSLSHRLALLRSPRWLLIWQSLKGRFWHYQLAVFKLLLEHREAQVQEQVKVISHIVSNIENEQLYLCHCSERFQMSYSLLVDSNVFNPLEEMVVFSRIGMVPVQHEFRIFLNMLAVGMFYIPGETCFVLARSDLDHRLVVESLQSFEIRGIRQNFLIGYRFKYLYVKSMMVLGVPLFFDRSFFDLEPQELVTNLINKEVSAICKELGEQQKELGVQLRSCYELLSRITNQNIESVVQCTTTEQQEDIYKDFNFKTQIEIFDQSFEDDRGDTLRNYLCLPSLSPAPVLTQTQENELASLFEKDFCKFLEVASSCGEVNKGWLKMGITMYKVCQQFRFQQIFRAEDFFGQESSQNSAAFSRLFPRIVSVLTPDNMLNLAKIIYFGLGLQKDLQYQVYLACLDKSIEKCLEQEINVNSLEEMVLDLSLRMPQGKLAQLIERKAEKNIQWEGLMQLKFLLYQEDHKQNT